MKVTAIIAAAGSGSRAQLGINKLLYPLKGGGTVISKTVSAFLTHPDIDYVIVVHAPGDKQYFEHLNRTLSGGLQLTEGSNTRAESVYRGLLATCPDTEIVLIHDGARPYVSANLISDCINAVKKYHSAVPVVPVYDTLASTDSGTIKGYFNRNKTAVVQTPQAYFYSDLLRIYQSAAAEKAWNYTDDSSIYAEKIGAPHTITGEISNKKLTYAEDFMFSAQTLRTGIGYDAHAWKENRKLVLGGVEIAHTRGLMGHSDADVLTHALMDAILSAAGLPDIGCQFPNTDAHFSNIASLQLLQQVVELLAQHEARTVNVSAVIICEQPKLQAYVEQMRNNIAAVIGIPPSYVGITCTTNERMGFVGREEGIAVQAVALIESSAK